MTVIDRRAGIGRTAGTNRDTGVGRRAGTRGQPDVERKMGYQPSLDGLRALSVGVVLLYHAGFTWMHGGFFGVEVFFVVSGFLITSLLIEETERSGRVSLGGFWLRRARRLLPALFGVLVVVAVWAALAGSAEQVSQLRRDIPWAVFYLGNWGQILGDVPYFAGEPPLLRHLWSLAVEEQWYLVWPLVFVGVYRLRWSARAMGALFVGAAVCVFSLMSWMQVGAPAVLGGPPALFEGLDRTNFMYLSTFTRAGGLLLGAGAAFVWRPWRWSGAADAPVGRMLDPIGAASIALLACASAVADITGGYVYRWLLPLVSIISLVAILAAVHPAAVGFRRILSWSPLVEVGKRSYGLYLWSWPIFVMLDATGGEVRPFITAMLVTVVVTELSYRYLETPIRTGAIGRWTRDRAPVTYAPLAGGALLIGCLVLYYANVQQFNRFVGGDDAAFALATEAPTDSAPGDASAPAAETAPSGSVAVTSVPPSTPVAAVAEPVASSANLAIVGDSQANALAINLPDGIGTVFPEVVNGSVDGCSVYDSGGVRSAVRFSNDFSICDGWQDQWASAASGSDVALVVVGAWDVFDIEDGATIYGFDTAEGDQFFIANLRSGIDALLAEGASVALLPVACMRPVDVDGAGVRALPERGDDARVAHVNELLGEAAAQYGPEVELLDGPDEWCNDEAIATDLGYRWDGVHVYKPGANLIYTKIAPQLLALAAP